MMMIRGCYVALSSVLLAVIGIPILLAGSGFLFCGCVAVLDFVDAYAGGKRVERIMRSWKRK
jgi:hypothetical protein